MNLRDSLGALRPEEEVEIEGAGAVLVRGAGATEVARITDMMADAEEAENPNEASLRALGSLAVRCLYDPASGERLYEDDAVDEFLALPAEVVEDLSTHALKLSGMGDMEEAKKD